MSIKHETIKSQNVHSKATTLCCHWKVQWRCEKILIQYNADKFGCYKSTVSDAEYILHILVYKEVSRPVPSEVGSRNKNTFYIDLGPQVHIYPEWSSTHFVHKNRTVIFHTVWCFLV